MRRLATCLAVLALAAGVGVEPAAAHESGKAEPRIAAGVEAAEGLERVLTVRLTDLDSGEPVTGATVMAQAEMTKPHPMRTAPWSLPEQSPGIYRARVRFAMPASWTVALRATGDNVVAASSELTVRIERGAEASSPPAAGDSGLAILPTRIEDTVADRDVATMAVLWLHGLSALGWIIGVLVMALALSTRPGVLAEGVRSRLAEGYRRWGAWLHWSCVPVIISTGIYNMLYVTPFPIAWRPSQFDALADIPYGPLYEAILIVKLGLFAALLITGTQVLIRATRLEPTQSPSSNPKSGFASALASALGPPGIFYLATVPLILAAAVTLRYIHILSHVAEVVSSR